MSFTRSSRSVVRSSTRSDETYREKSRDGTQVRVLSPAPPSVIVNALASLRRGATAADKHCFDVFVGGHLTHLSSRRDVELTREHALDVHRTTKRVHAETDLMKVMARTAEAAGGGDNKYLLFRAFLDEVIETSAREIERRWAGRLAYVDVFMQRHVRTARIYVRWDDRGSHGSRNESLEIA